MYNFSPEFMKQKNKNKKQIHGCNNLLGSFCTWYPYVICFAFFCCLVIPFAVAYESDDYLKLVFLQGMCTCSVSVKHL